MVRVNSGRATIHGRYFRAYRIFGISKKYESSGFPDLQAFKNDNYLLLEVKKPKEKQNDNQIRFEKFAKECGAKIHVVRSVDDVIEILKGDN